MTTSSLCTRSAIAAREKMRKIALSQTEIRAAFLRAHAIIGYRLSLDVEARSPRGKHDAGVDAGDSHRLVVGLATSARPTAWPDQTSPTSCARTPSARKKNR
jgi:hypothetical protein